MKKIITLSLAIAVLAGNIAFSSPSIAALLGESYKEEVTDLKGPYTGGGRPVPLYKSATCDALKKTAKALGGTCTLTVITPPKNGNGGKGTCVCLWPTQKSDDSMAILSSAMNQ